MSWIVQTIIARENSGAAIANVEVDSVVLAKRAKEAIESLTHNKNYAFPIYCAVFEKGD